MVHETRAHAMLPVSSPVARQAGRVPAGPPMPQVLQRILAMGNLAGPFRLGSG